MLGVAAEHGTPDPAERVALLARVLLDRPLTAATGRAPCSTRQKGAYAEDVLGARERRRAPPGSTRTLWRVARLLSRVDDALDARPKGNLGARALATLPVVGVVGGYRAERVALRRRPRPRRLAGH